MFAVYLVPLSVDPSAKQIIAGKAFEVLVAEGPSASTACGRPPLGEWAKA
jgi:hypothetical protein